MNKKAETLLETIIKVGKKINLVLMALLICACSFFGLGQIDISHGGLNNLGTKHVTMKIVKPNYTYSGRGYMTARYYPVIFIVLDDVTTIETGDYSNSTPTITNITLSEQEKTITSTGSKGYVKDYTKFKNGEHQYAGWAGTDRSLYSKVVTSDEYTSETFMTLLKKYKTKIGNLPLAHYNHMYMGGAGLLENTTILSGYGYSKRFYDDLSKALAYYDVGYTYKSGKYTFTLPGEAKTDDMYGLFAPFTGVYNANNYLKERSITIGSKEYTIYVATGDSDSNNKEASGAWGKNRNRTNAANYITADNYGALIFSIESERLLTIGRGTTGKSVSGADNSYGANLKKILTALYDTKDADGKELATSDGDKAALVAAIADSTRQSAYKLMKGAYENGQIDATLTQYFNKINPSKSYNLSTIKTKDLLLANNYGIRHSTFNIKNTLVYIPNDTLDYLQTNSGKTGISLPSSGTAKAFNQLNSKTASASEGLRVLFYTFDEKNSRGGIEMSTANLEQNSSGKLVAGKESSGIFFNGMYKYHSSSKVTANSGGMTSVMDSIKETNSKMGYTFSVIWDEIWSKPATNFMGTDINTDKQINELLTSDDKFDLGGKKYTGSGSKITLAEMIEFYAYGGMEEVNKDYYKVTGYSIDPHFKKLKETIKTKLDSLAKDEKALAVASNVIGTMLDIRTEIKGDTYDYKWAGGAYDGNNYIGDFWDYYCAYMVSQYANDVNKVIPIAEAVKGGLKDYSNEVLNISDIDLYCYMYMIAKATEGTNLNNGLSARYFDAITEMLACAMYGKVPMGANIQFITGNVNTSPSDGSVKWSSDAGLVPWASYLVSYEDIKNYVYQSRSDASVALPYGAYYLLKQQAINNVYAYDMINKGIYGGLSTAELDSNTYTATYGNNGRTSIMTFAAVNSNALKYYAVGGAYVSSATSQYGSNLNPWNSSMFNTDSNYLLSAINTMGKYPSTLYSNYPLEMPAGSIIDGTWTRYIVKYHIGISKSRFNDGVTWKHAYKAGTGSKGDIYVDKNKLTKISDSISSINMAKGTGMTIIAGSEVSSKQVASSTLAINYDNIASNKGAIPEYIAIALNRYYHTVDSAGEKMFRVIAGYGSSQYLDSGYGCGTYIAGAMQGHAIKPKGEHIIFGIDAELLWTGSKSAPNTTTERTKLDEYSHETIVNGNASTVEEKAIMNLTYKVYEIGAKKIEREKNLQAEDTARSDTLQENANALYKLIKNNYKDNIYIRVTSSKADGTNVDQQFTENDKIVEKSEPTLEKVLKNVKSEKEDKSAYNEPIKLTEGELKALFGLNETKVYTGYYLDFSQVAVNAGKSDTKSITPAWYAEYGIKVDLCTKNKNGEFVNIFSNAEFNSGKLVQVDDSKLNAAFDVALLHAKKSDGTHVFETDADISETIGAKIKAGAEQYTYAYAGLKSASELVNVAGDATKSTFDGKTAMSLRSNYYLTDAGKTKKRTTPVHDMYLSVTVGPGIDAKGALLYEDNKQHSRKFEFKDGEAGSKAVGTPVYVDLKFDVDTKAKIGSKTLGDVLNEYLDKYSSFGISAEAVNNGSIVLEGSVNSENELKWSDTTKGSTVKGLKLYYSASDASHSKTQEAKLNTPIEINKEKFKELMGLDTEVGTSTNYGHYLNFFYDWNNIKVSLAGSSSELPGNYKFYNTIKVKLWGKGASGFEPLNEILWEYDDGNYIMTGFSTIEGEKTQMYVQGISSKIPRELQPYPMLNTWYNIPQTYAEIKQGTINPNGDGSIEKYDAMSGVPSTEKLYFTSGGSEFIVEIATALMQGEKTTRTYTSKFNQITDGCEFMLGDQLHGGVGKQEVTTEWGRNGNSYILGNSSNKANTKVTEWYNLATPEGASSYNVTVNAHRTDTVIKAEWTGTITNADSGAKPSDGTSAVGYDPGPGNNALSDMCAVESNSNALAGQYGEPGSMGTERNSDYNWNVDSYNKALENAAKWAKEMEDASATAKGNIAKLSNSDGVTRSYHSGKATITIKIDGISVGSMADQQKNVQPDGTWAGTTQKATTDNYGTYILKSHNEPRLGTTWREDYGAKAVRGASGGCVKSCWEFNKYQARAEKTIKYISSYTVTRGVNSASATPNYTEFTYRDSWCGATSYTKTDATWSFTPCSTPEHTHSSSCNDPETGAQTCGMSEHKHTTSCGTVNTTSGSHSVHTCTHSCGSWTSLVETKAVQMGNPTFKIVVTFENNYVTSDGPNNVDQKTPTNTLPAHVLCGPCCEHTTLPTIYDKWQQQSEYDYIQIVKLNVFKISRSYLEGGELADILYTEDESIMANVIQGEPNIYYNIAAMNDTYRNSKFESRKEVSLSGRVRYSVQPQQHDNVLWDEKMVTDKAGGKTVTGHGQNKRSYDCDGQSGTVSNLNPNKVSVNGHENEWSDGILYNRTNDSSGEQYSDKLEEAYKNYTTDEKWFENILKDTVKKGYTKDTLDEKDIQTYEYNRFDFRRKTENTMYVVSDMLILQTSTGDQSVLYFEKKNTAETQQHFVNNEDVERAIRWNGDDSEVVARQAVDEMWNNNTKSAGNKSATNWIATGGYIGLGGASPYNKFSGGNNKQNILTIFDDGSAADANKTQTDDKANVTGPQTVSRVTSITNSLDANLFKASPNKADGYELRMNRNTRFRNLVDELQINPIAGNKGYNTGNAYQGYLELIDYVFDYSKLPDYWKQEVGDGGSTIKELLDEPNRYNEEENEILNGKFYVPRADFTLGTTEAIYTAGQNKVNNIIIHTPVSIANSMVISLEDARDQRTTELYDEGLIDNNSYGQVCPRVPGSCQFSYLDCHYFEDTVLYSTDFEDTANIAVNNDGVTSVQKITTRYVDDYGITHIVDSTGQLDLELPEGFEIVPASFTGGVGNALSCKGTRWQIPLSALGIESYNGNDRIRIDMDIKLNDFTGPTMVVSFYGYDFYIPTTSGVFTWNTGNGVELQADKSLAGNGYKLSMVFDFYNIEKCEAYINGNKVNYTRVNNSSKITKDLIGDYLNIGSWGRNDSYPANFIIDNLVITKLAGLNHHTEACYKEVYECEVGTYYTCQVPVRFNYTGSVQSFTAPQSGTYLLEAYGASGGNSDTTAGSAGGRGGYTSGKVFLTKGETIYVYVGGQGTASTALGTGGGWNGGGHGGPNGFGGGGMTHFSYSGTDDLSKKSADVDSYFNTKKLILVAGGGGGADNAEGTLNGSNDGSGGHGGGLVAGNAKIDGVDGLLGGISPKPTQNTNGGGTGLGGTQTSGYAMGIGESATYATDTGGAGGGYYGGYVTNHTSGGAGGGSGYISKFVTNGKTITGANQGNGYATVTLVDHVHNANCTKEVSLNNTHVHTADCITNSKFLQSLLFGAYTTDDKTNLTKYLGGTIVNHFENQPSVITALTTNWSYVTSLSNLSSLTTSGSLVMTARDHDPYVELDIEIQASAVRQIKITYTASGMTTPSVGAIYFNTGSGYNEHQRVNSTTNMSNTTATITFNMSDNVNWAGNITGLRLDLPNGGAQNGTRVTVTKMEFIGFGTATTRNETIPYDAHIHTQNCTYNPGVSDSTVWEFNFTGNIQTLTVPTTGTYRLEVWGAQGGSYVNNGGKGGYSKGTVQLTAGQTIYVVVGGAGGNGSSSYTNPGSGGYNGGGTGGKAGQSASGSGGGGATHIATRSGLLSSLSSYKSDVLIVAGGGGGAGSYSGGDRHGGAGGGETGGKTGDDSKSSGRGGGGGTQTAGGATSNSRYTGQAGSFGKGGNGYTGSLGGYGGGGGGGGWYGGGSGGTGDSTTSCGGGGGGSGYIGGVSNGSTTANTHLGNGLAKITAMVNSPGTWTCGNLPLNSYSDLNNNVNPVQHITGSSGDRTFNYVSNALQTFSVPITGTYTLEAWGAQGGGAEGGKGGYAKSIVNLTAGQTLYIAAGSRGSTSNQSRDLGYGTYKGGWPLAGHGVGAGSGGGGMSGVFTGNSITQANALVIGGGGGGVGLTTARTDAETPNPTGSMGGGSGHFYMVGSYWSDMGGGGSGYWGGRTIDGDDPCVGHAGTNYSTGTGSTNQYGVNSGNGRVKISWGTSTQVITYTGPTYNAPPIRQINHIRIVSSSVKAIGIIDGTTNSVNSAMDIIRNNWSTIPKIVDGSLNPLFTCDGIPNKHVHTAKCNTPTLILDCNEPHHEGEHYDKSNPICWSACMNDENHKAAKDRVVVVDNDGTAKVITRGNFINNDYKFSVYYPNIGDFYETGAYGHTTLQQSRGLGYVNGTDTTQWIREKKIKFEFDVLLDNPATGQWEYYSAGQWINLPITTTGDTDRDWHASQADIAINTYNFYNLLSNDEMASSKVEFAIEAINCYQGGISKDAVYEKNDFLEYTNVFESTNRNRESGYQTQNGNAIGFVSNHGAYVNNYIDLVGRIGNMFITDTEDLRFSNFFKKVDNDNWIIEPIIHEVYEDQQARFIAIAKSDSINGVNNATYDVRGVLTSEATKYFNTWGTQDWMDGVIEYYSLPLSASLNNIEQLRTEEMKIGYNVLWEITTIGNYDKLQVAPFFYAYDTQTGTISPVDVWYKINNSFRAINIYNLLNEPAYLDIMKNNLQDTITDPKWTAFKEQGLDNYILSLDWVAEKARRGFGGTEEDITRNTALMYGTPIWLGDTDGDGIEESTVAPLTTPYGNSYTLGTLQLLTPASRARTFIGSSNTLSENFNGDSNTDLNHMIADEKYGYHAQRWHLKLGLPSSAEFVFYNSAVGHIHPLDVAPGTETRNMDLLKEKNADGTSRYVIMMAVDIKAIGSTWNLRYDAYGNVGQRIKVRGNNVILPADMPNVIAVYDTLDTSLIDIQIIGTH